MTTDADTLHRLISRCLSSYRSARTQRAYAADIDTVRLSLGQPDPASLFIHFIGMGRERTHEQLIGWCAALKAKDTKRSTINRRLSALRMVFRSMFRAGLCGWELEIESLPTNPYHVTPVVNTTLVASTIDRLRSRDDWASQRDAVILTLLSSLALRPSEVVSLQVDDLKHNPLRIEVMAFGKGERRAIPIAANVFQQLVDWIRVRGTSPGALVVRFPNRGKDMPLSTKAIQRVVTRRMDDQIEEVNARQLRHSRVLSVASQSFGDADVIADAARMTSRHGAVLYSRLASGQKPNQS